MDPDMVDQLARMLVECDMAKHSKICDELAITPGELYTLFTKLHAKHPHIARTRRRAGRTQHTIDQLIAYLRADPERRAFYAAHTTQYANEVLHYRVPRKLRERVTVVTGPGSEARRGRSHALFVDHYAFDQAEQKRSDAADTIRGRLDVLAKQRDALNRELAQLREEAAKANNLAGRHTWAEEDGVS